MMFGTFPHRENFSSLITVSSFPTMSENVLGRYFSILKARKTTERPNISVRLYYRFERRSLETFYKPRCVRIVLGRRRLRSGGPVVGGGGGSLRGGSTWFLVIVDVHHFHFFSLRPREKFVGEKHGRKTETVWNGRQKTVSFDHRRRWLRQSRHSCLEFHGRRSATAAVRREDRRTRFHDFHRDTRHTHTHTSVPMSISRIVVITRRTRYYYYCFVQKSGKDSTIRRSGLGYSCSEISK